jgi:hypothetical protein
VRLPSSAYGCPSSELGNRDADGGRRGWFVGLLLSVRGIEGM